MFKMQLPFDRLHFLYWVLLLDGRRVQGVSSKRLCPPFSSAASLCRRLLCKTLQCSSEHIIRDDVQASMNGFTAFKSKVCAAGRLRLQGELSVSRSIGDLPYTEFGLIATPTLSKWVEINSLQDGTWLHFSLILATDGLFESLTSQEICQAAWSVAKGNEAEHTINFYAM